MSALRVVPLTPDMRSEIHQAAALLNRVFAPEGSWTTMAEALDEVHEMLAPDRFIRLAMDGNEVVGWIGGIPEYNGNVWELHPLLVKPERQRQGVGTQLIQDFECQVQARDGLTIQLGTDDVSYSTSLGGADLYTETWEQIRTIQNFKGHPYSFYQKQGYTIIGVMPDANGRGKPDIIMGKAVCAKGESEL